MRSMDRLGNYLLHVIQRNPILAIQWVIVVTTFIGAFYIFTPLYIIGKTIQVSPLSTVLTSQFAFGLWALCLLVGSVIAGIGLIIKEPKLRSYGWFLILLARLYQVLAILLAVGFLPLSWLYPATLGLIALILWARSRVVNE